MIERENHWFFVCLFVCWYRTITLHYYLCGSSSGNSNIIWCCYCPHHHQWFCYCCQWQCWFCYANSCHYLYRTVYIAYSKVSVCHYCSCDCSCDCDCDCDCSCFQIYIFYFQIGCSVGWSVWYYCLSFVVYIQYDVTILSPFLCLNLYFYCCCCLFPCPVATQQYLLLMILHYWY